MTIFGVTIFKETITKKDKCVSRNIDRCCDLCVRMNWMRILKPM